MARGYSPPQLWVRDPFDYIDKVLEVPWGVVRTVWSAEFVRVTGIDPRKALNHLLPNRAWEALMIDARGAFHMNGSSHQIEQWEHWKYGDSMKRLMECFVSGKRFVVEFPGVNVPAAERNDFMKYYHRFREACPQAKPHIHGIVSYGKGFGSHPFSVDFDLAHLPSRGAVQLPNGRLVRRDELIDIEESNAHDRHEHWARMVGRRNLLGLAGDEDERLRFELQAMSWAATNWEKVTATRVQGIPRVQKLTDFSAEEEKKSYAARLKEMSDSDAMFRHDEANRSGAGWGWGRRKALPTDRIACDTCSLADVCKAFRQGSVCAVPNTEGDSLAKKFGTRSSSAITAGLQELMQLNAGRIQMALEHEQKNMQDEEQPQGLDPELSKLIDKTISHGEKVAKLIDPRLRPGPAALVQVNNGQQSQQGLNATPQQLTATVFRELEAKGMKREEITPEIINDYVKVLSNMSPSGDMNDDDYIEAEVEE